MADFHWPGTAITLPFEDGTINTRYYDTITLPHPDGSTIDDRAYRYDATYDRQAVIQSRFTQFNGAYPVYYQIMGEGRPVYFRVVGEADLGVTMQVLRVDDRDAEGNEVTFYGDEPNPVYGVRGWTDLSSDPYDDGTRHWRKACACRLTLQDQVRYVIRVASYSNRGTTGQLGQPGYESGYGQVMYFEADYDDITPRNDYRNNAKEIYLYDNERPYISAPVLNTGYTTLENEPYVTRDGNTPVTNYPPDPPALLDLLATAWWRYRPLASGPFRVSLAMKDQEYFPGQYPGVLYALRNKSGGGVEFLASSRYNSDNGFPGIAPYVQLDVTKGDDILIVAGHYQNFSGVAQKYVITATGPMSRESFSLRLKDNKTWELLSGGPYTDHGRFHIYANGGWYRQVDSETRGAVPLALRMKDNKTWQDVLWFLPGSGTSERWWVVGNSPQDLDGKPVRSMGSTNGSVSGSHAYQTWRYFAAPPVGGASQFFTRAGHDHNLGNDNQGRRLGFLTASVDVYRMGSEPDSFVYPQGTQRTQYTRTTLHIDTRYILERSNLFASSLQRAVLTFSGRVYSNITYNQIHNRTDPAYQITGAPDNSIPPWRFYVDDVTGMAFPLTTNTVGEPQDMTLPKIDNVDNNMNVYPSNQLFKTMFDAQGSTLTTMQNTTGFLVVDSTGYLTLQGSTGFQIEVELPVSRIADSRGIDLTIYCDSVNVTLPQLEVSKVSLKHQCQASVWLDLYGR